MLRRLEVSIRGYLIILVNVFFIIFWSIIYFLYINNSVSSIPSDSVSSISASLVQALGILLGFSGLSVFFFEGKVNDVETKIYLSTNRCHSLEKRMATRCTYLEGILKKASDSGKATNDLKKKLEDRAKDITKYQKIIEKVIKDNEEIINSVKRLSRISFMYSFIVFAFLVMALISSILSPIINQPLVLSIAIWSLSVGVVSFFFRLMDHYQTLSGLMQLYVTSHSLRLLMEENLSIVVDDRLRDSFFSALGIEPTFQDEMSPT